MGTGNSVYEIIIGFIFKSFWDGIFIITLVKTSGYLLAFVLGRFLFRSWV
jgi:uncharacterized membrane protein YdjX (TVP38/TMEM64 family)